MKPKALVLIGGILLMVGAAMPWATMTSSFLGLSRSLTGLEGDGIFSALGGLILLLLAIFSKENPGKTYSPFGVIISILCGLLIISKVFTVAGLSTQEDVAVSMGIGLSCLSPLGALLGFIGSVTKIPQVVTQPAPVTPTTPAQ